MSKVQSRVERSGVVKCNPHDLISRVGLTQAKNLAATKFERTCIDAAGAALAAQDNADELIYGTLLATVMPHKSIDGQHLRWRHETAEASYILTGGRGADKLYYGVPFGSKARMILLYFFDKSVRTKSVVVEVGASMHDFVASVSNSKCGGATYTLIADQAERLGACRLTVVPKPEYRSAKRCYRLIGEFHEPVKAEQSRTERKELHVTQTRRYLRKGERGEMPKMAVVPIYEDYKSQAFAIRRSALFQISNNSLAIDAYLELCSILPRLKRPRLIDWDTIKQRAGPHFIDKSHMRRAFLRALELAQAVYPQAKVEIQQHGVLFHPSEPPIIP